MTLLRSLGPSLFPHPSPVGRLSICRPDELGALRAAKTALLVQIAGLLEERMAAANPRPKKGKKGKGKKRGRAEDEDEDEDEGDGAAVVAPSGPDIRCFPSNYFDVSC